MLRLYKTCIICGGTGITPGKSDSDKELVFQDNHLVSWRFKKCYACNGSGYDKDSEYKAIPKAIILDEMNTYHLRHDLLDMPKAPYFSKEGSSKAYNYYELLGITRKVTLDFFP